MYSRVLCVVLLASGLSACVDSESVPVPQQAVEQVEQAVIGGQQDTTHPAVVGFVSGGMNATCSGVIVEMETDGDHGWVLTSHNCLASVGESALLYRGSDTRDISSMADLSTFRIYGIRSVHLYQDYDLMVDPTLNDFALVRFSINRDAHESYAEEIESRSTPVIPLAEADHALAAGDSVVTVGFGATQTPLEGADTNTQRHMATNLLSGVTDTKLLYQNIDGTETRGACTRDQGAPVLATIGGQEVVVGIVSAEGENCLGEVVSGRVHGALLSWIGETIAQNGVRDPETVCNECRRSQLTESCQVEAGWCQEEGCDNVTNCVEACGSSDEDWDVCIQSCYRENQAAYTALNILENCLCNNACLNECDGIGACINRGTFWYDDPSDGCYDGCMTFSCNESEGDGPGLLDACAQDNTCARCASQSLGRPKSDWSAECQANAALNALNGCRSSDECKDYCKTSGKEDDIIEDNNGAASQDDAGPQVANGGCSTAAPGQDRAPGHVWWLVLGLLGVGIGRRRR